MDSEKNLEYIGTSDYKKLEDKIKTLKDGMEELQVKQRESRKLRYSEVDVEAQRKAGRIGPDELWVSRHLINNNIMREQPSYIQYITQSQRAVICEDEIDKSNDLTLLDQDLTAKIRYEDWEQDMFPNVDGFQANGYGIMELVEDSSTTGDLSYESVEYADFGFLADSRKIQQLEMTGRWCYFTRTKLTELCGDPTKPKDSNWDKTQVDKVLASEPSANVALEDYELKDKSLYPIMKVMFRINGVVNVGWAYAPLCDDWLRKPRPLYIGRRQLIEPQPPEVNPMTQQPADPNAASMFASFQQAKMQAMGKFDMTQWAISIVAQGMTPPSKPSFETMYPYTMFPYLNSENSTISNLKGRVYLDQDAQEAVSSLTSSTITQARRSAGLYGSKDASDPNDDVLMQSNITLKPNSIVNSKVSFTYLPSPEPGMFSSIQTLEAANQNESGNVNFAVMNRKDSRKTSEEMKMAQSESQSLDTVQVVNFSIALKKLYGQMSEIIKSRVISGLIIVNATVLPLYGRKFKVKPSGDVDVIEKAQMVETMMNAWPVVKDTACASVFLMDLLEKMFPNNAAKYVKAMSDASAQQNSQQMQMLKSAMEQIKAMAAGIVKLSKEPGMFSETGRIHAFPIVEHYADLIEATEKQLGMKK